MLQNRLNQKTVNSVCLVSEHANKKVKDNLTSVFEPLHCTSELCISKPVGVKHEFDAPELTNNELSVQSPLFLSWQVINQLILFLCPQVVKRTCLGVQNLQITRSLGLLRLRLQHRG